MQLLSACPGTVEVVVGSFLTGALPLALLLEIDDMLKLCVDVLTISGLKCYQNRVIPLCKVK